MTWRPGRNKIYQNRLLFDFSNRHRYQWNTAVKRSGTIISNSGKLLENAIESTKMHMLNKFNLQTRRHQINQLNISTDKSGQFVMHNSISQSSNILMSLQESNLETLKITCIIFTDIGLYNIRIVPQFYSMM